MTQSINLYSLFTTTGEEATAQGGVFVETLNAEGDGVRYIPVSTADLVNNIDSYKPQQPQED